MKNTNGLYLASGDFLPYNAAPLSAGRHVTRAGMGQYIAEILPNPDAILRARGMRSNTYKMVMEDPIVSGHVLRRESAVTALPRRVEPGKCQREDIVASVRDMVENLRVDKLIPHILEGKWLGYKPFEVMWDTVQRPRAAWRIGQLEPLPSSWFQFNKNNQLHWQAQGQVLGEACPANKFIVARHKATYENPYGVPVAGQAFWPVMFMRSGRKWWSKFVQRFGQPYLVGKLPRSAKDSEYDELADMLMDMMEDAVAVIPEDGSVTVIDGRGGQAGNLHPQYLEHQRLELAYLFLGQNQASEKNSTHASANAGTGVTNAVADSDAAFVVDVVQAAIELHCHYNYALAPQDCPKFVMEREREADVALSERDANMKNAGANFTPQYFQRAYGLQDGDLVITDNTATKENAFSESATDPSAATDQIQAWLDAAIAARLAEILPDVTQELLSPVLALLREHAEPDTLMDVLSAQFDQWGDATLRKALAELMFAVDVIGRISAAQELV